MKGNGSRTMIDAGTLQHGDKFVWAGVTLRVLNAFRSGYARDDLVTIQHVQIGGARPGHVGTTRFRNDYRVVRVKHPSALIRERAYRNTRPKVTAHHALVYSEMRWGSRRWVVECEDCLYVGSPFSWSHAITMAHYHVARHEDQAKAASDYLRVINR